MVNTTRFPRRFTFYPVLAYFLGALLVAGCGKPADASKSQVTATTNSTPPPKEAGPGPGERVCFACKGEGMVPCFAPGCVDGQVDCPAPCIKLNKGIWVKIPGRPDQNETMQLIVVDGKQVWVSSHHPGVTYTSRADGGWDMHTCPVCNGTGKVKCDVCKGTGQVTCPVCNGKKFIPVAWTPTDNPYFNRQPDIIRLADGQVILGRVAASVGDDRTIVTRDKKILHVNASDILPRPDTNASAAQTAPAK